MKIDNSLIIGLIEDDNPFPNLWSFILKRIWNISTGDLRLYYNQESRMVDFEALIETVYPEFYSEILAKACENYNLNLSNVDTIVFMDAMSMREGILVAQELKGLGMDTELGYGFSALPSDTTSFKDKMNPRKIAGGDLYTEIKNPQRIQISGDERVIWSSFPDRLLSTLSSGKVKYGNVTDLYEITMKIISEILSKTKSQRIMFTSDHGYMRADSTYTFKSSRKDQKELAKTLGGNRFTRSVGKSERKLVESGLLVLIDGYAIVRGLYTWPVRGKYSLYQHGGLSLVECMTPVILVDKGAGGE